MERTLDKVEFFRNGKAFTLQLSNEKLLVLKCAKKTSVKQSLATDDMSINILNVICTSYGKDEEGKDFSEKIDPNVQTTKVAPAACYALIINYWEKSKHNQRRHKVIKLHTLKEKDCLEWHKFIQLKLTEVLKEHGYTRPVKLLVFINPFSGKKKAQSIHKKIVSPLFKLAGIEETVVISQYRDHAKEYTETNDLSSYDGVIAMGGDGTFNEMANGVLIAEQQRRNISLDQQGTPLSEPINFTQPSIKLGYIPAGSGNAMSCSTQGISDPETATLQIICGESHPMDVISTYNCEETFIRFCFAFVSCGFVGYSVVLSERLRFLGPLRYRITNILAVLKRPLVPCKIFYKPSSSDDPVFHDSDKPQCRSPCPVCLDQVRQDFSLTGNSARNDVNLKEVVETTSTNQFASEDKLQSDAEHEELGDVVEASLSLQRSSEEIKSKVTNTKVVTDESLAFKSDENLKVISGEFFLILCLPNASMFDRSPLGLAPSAHLSDGTMELSLGRRTSRFRALKYLLSITKKESRPQYSFMEAHRVKGLKFQPLLQHELEGGHFSSDNVSTVSQPLASSEKKEEKSVERKLRGVWCTDGEVTEQDISSLWVHRGLITIFATGVERETANDS